MKYVHAPSTISVDSLKGQGFCFAPSRYTSFHPDKPSRFDILSNLANFRAERQKILPSGKYVYIEIGDINVNNGSISYKQYRGRMMPSLSPLVVKNGDILISTVRTYRKGIGYVDADMDAEGLTCTPAMMVLSENDERVSKEYLFSFLRSDFFVEQILSFQNRGMYPRLDDDTVDFVYIPLPRSAKELHLVSTLQKMALNKEKEIRRKAGAIDELIASEIGEEQQDEYAYSFPSIKDLRTTGRLDTGPYTNAYKIIQNEIENYKHGASTLEELGYTISRGQNLQVSNIGRSVYSEIPTDGFYKLLLSKYFTDWMTVENQEYLGNTKKLKTISKGDIIFSCRGDLGRVFVSCEDLEDTITNIDNVHIRNSAATLEQGIFVATFLNYLRKKGYLSQISVQGSGADSFTKYHFQMIKIPNFDTPLQKKIASLYFSPQAASFETPLPSQSEDFDAFLHKDSDWNEKAGITQLDLSAKSVRQMLTEVMESIILDKPLPKKVLT